MKSRSDKLRKIIQIISLLLINSNFKTFFTGNLYQGSFKKLCIPVLNCHSCPFAVLSCPVGLMQQFLLKGLRQGIDGFLYVFGIVASMGLVFGRFFCGWICPFGFLQELLYRGRKSESENVANPLGVPYPNMSNPINPFRVRKRKEDSRKEIWKMLFRVLSVIFLFGFVLILPWLITNRWGLGSAMFCRYICPAGTFEAGIWGAFKGYAVLTPALILKIFIFLLVFYFSIKIFRFWCRVCPLGLLLGFFNKISFLKLYNNEKCNNCLICRRVCPMDIDMPENINSIDCIRCKRCVDACPQRSLSLSWLKPENKNSSQFIEVSKKWTEDSG
ncbi:MAG: 4Fe-4S binding protein [Elusimicrobia bacterium]|nr:4Fe-4S binding protein [Elusimicrobiota bacterium]